MATIKYKNMEVDASVGRMIKYMAPVEDNRELLYNLSNNWDSLSLLSQLGDAGMNMSEIKNNFTKLSSKLINHLSIELLDKCVATMNFKAQVAVDIVIRNLFERTADIGFLATDEDIMEFLRQNRSKYATHFPENLAQMRKRFLEYVQKYSVYFDIVLKFDDEMAGVLPTSKRRRAKRGLLCNAHHGGYADHRIEQCGAQGGRLYRS